MPPFLSILHARLPPNQGPKESSPAAPLRILPHRPVHAKKTQNPITQCLFPNWRHSRTTGSARREASDPGGSPAASRVKAARGSRHKGPGRGRPAERSFCHRGRGRGREGRVGECL